MTVPKLSIGLPVYNGQNYLSGCLQSLLGQSFCDFELVISDNGSTDHTQDICRAFARKDSRVRYIRQDRNLGAAGNFDFVLHAARAPLFKWAAHDDLHAPTYVAECVRLLDSRPDAVLAHSLTQVIDAQGVPLSREEMPHLYDPAGRPLDHAAGRVRFLHIVLHTQWCFEIFGVMRRKLAIAAGGHRAFYGADKVLLAKLAMHGPMLRVPEALFLRREHPGNSTSIPDPRLRMAWINPEAQSVATDARLQCLMGYLAALFAQDTDPGTRAGGCWVLLRYLLRWHKLSAALADFLPAMLKPRAGQPSSGAGTGGSGTDDLFSSLISQARKADTTWRDARTKLAAGGKR